MTSQPTLFQKSIAEVLGTFLLVFLGCGSVHASVLMGAQSGVWQVAVVWGIAIALAIFVCDAISGAHINPAMTIAFAFWGRHPWSQVVPYIASQLVGAILAAAVLYFLFSGFIASKETEKGVVRGEPGSIVTAMCYGEYSPNPGSIASATGHYDPVTHDELKSKFPVRSAWVAEFLGTMILACVVFSLTDTKNTHRPQANLAPVFIGLTVSVLISVVAPLTQAGFNPARDFGPRLFAYFAGWGKVAIPGPADSGWLTIYIVAPILGALTGGGFYQKILRPAYPNQTT
jgi:glycerol uptake facilitator protein